MFCYRCGATMPDTATACPQCGTAVQQTPPPAAAPPTSVTPPAAYQPVPTGQPPQYGQPGESSGQATASLILGILSVTCFGLLAGIPAVILGHIAKSNIRKSGGRLSGDGKATAGLIMGYISIALIPIMLSVMIPNLLRSRMAANESSATITLRTVNTVQVEYQTQYPAAGYARDLATLGPGPSGTCPGNGSERYACLLDGVLGRSTCTGRTWCTKNGFKYSLTSPCPEQEGSANRSPCDAYVIVAVPAVIGSTGSKSFCSTADAVVRTRRDASPMIPPTVEECESWSQVE